MENKEVWKDIPEYERLYQVSNLGRVKSIERIVIYNDGRKYNYPEKILKPSKDKDNYLLVNLYKQGKGKTLKIHRLVCLTFLENPLNLPCVNHKDENKENNHVENLEWCTVQHNVTYNNIHIKRGFNNRGKYKGENSYWYNKKRSEETKQKISKAKSIPIQQYTKDMTFIKEWDSATTASRDLNINKGHICSCCKGKRKSASGFIWKYKE